MLKISRRHRDEVLGDQELLKHIREVAAPSYEDSSAILEREITRCVVVYLGHDEQGTLRCFFVVNWEDVLIEGRPHPSVYMGLAATDADTKSSGLALRLLNRFRDDAMAWEREHEQRLLLWGTVANPTIFLSSFHFGEMVEPHKDGSFSAFGCITARALREHIGAGTPDKGIHPFLLVGCADRTRYSDSEVVRIRRLSEQKRFTLFEEVGLDERRGDRLLFITATPMQTVLGSLPSSILGMNNESIKVTGLGG